MEETNEKKQERAVLVGLNADCFTVAQTATEETLDELEALLETARCCKTAIPPIPTASSARARPRK